MAKFCPQCGTAIAEIKTSELDIKADEPTQADPPVEPIVTAEDVANVEPDPTLEDGAAPDETSELDAEESFEDPASREAIDAAPLAENSLAAAAESVADTPKKSKTGLWVSLGILALAAAGGGTYALDLLGGDGAAVDTRAAAEDIAPPAVTPSAETAEETPASDSLSPVQAAYQAAILTGRISDLGEFAASYPNSSLAKDAEAAAFTSLKRQNSVLAFTAFTEQFPDADTSSYTGPRVNGDIDAAGSAVDPSANPAADVSANIGLAIEENISATPGQNPLDAETNLRLSITTRAAELEPFIAQGDTAYALSVIDEMLSLPDLSEDEATYLLNLRAKAETAQGLMVEGLDVQPAPDQTFAPSETPSTAELLTEPPADVSNPLPADPVAPAVLFDTPAKPLERFGAITPDDATEPGECDVEFSVNPSGALVNIAPACTQPMFIAPAREAVSEWVYTPALLNGVPVQQDGLSVKLKFHLE